SLALSFLGPYPYPFLSPSPHPTLYINAIALKKTLPRSSLPLFLMRGVFTFNFFILPLGSKFNSPPDTSSLCPDEKVYAFFIDLTPFTRHCSCRQRQPLPL